MLAACRPGGMQFLTPHPLFREDGVIFIPADCLLKIDNTPEEKLSSGVLHLDKYGDILRLVITDILALTLPDSAIANLRKGGVLWTTS